MLIAGTFVLAGSILASVHSTYWLILTILVGVNLVVFAVTGFCHSANILYKMAIKPGLQQTGRNNPAADMPECI